MATVKGFTILSASLPDYDSVVAEIRVSGGFVALLSHAPGKPVSMEWPEKVAVRRKVDPHGFLQAVEEARLGLPGTREPLIRSARRANSVAVVSCSGSTLGTAPIDSPLL